MKNKSATDALLLALGNGALAVLAYAARTRYPGLDADDLAAETCRRALARGKADQGEPYGLLWVIMRHLAIDEYRSARYRRTVSLDADSPGFLNMLSIPENPGEKIENKMRLEAALRGLSRPLAQGVRAYLVSDTYAEAAQRLGIKVGTFRSRLSRAREKIKRQDPMRCK